MRTIQQQIAQANRLRRLLLKYKDPRNPAFARVQERVRCILHAYQEKHRCLRLKTTGVATSQGKPAETISSGGGEAEAKVQAPA